MNLIAKLRQEIAAAEARILELQQACPHPDAAVIVRSIGHNEDGEPFRHCTCGFCEKQFTRSGRE